MFADRVVVPTKLRQVVLRQLHSGHLGINLMKLIALSVIYWPNIDTDIERTVKRCIQCMEAQKNPPRIMDSRWTYPEQSWSRIHVDFADSINGISFLLFADAHSKWPEFFLMQQTDTQSMITVLRRLFSQHGLPEPLVSDNGSQFTSESFQQFCKSWCITPLYHPQSNGQAVLTRLNGPYKSKGEQQTRSY